MISRFAILILTIVCIGCKGNSRPYIIYAKGGPVPHIVADASLMPLAAEFAQQFEQVTGSRPLVAAHASADAVSMIELRLVKAEQPAFSINQRGHSVIVEGTDAVQTAAGMAYVLSEYAGRAAGVSSGGVPVQQIAVPEGFNYTQTPAFEYREPYFPDNFNTDLRKWNNTHTLEDTWGLWGHNIGKVIKVTPDMYALVDGKPNAEQFCFSSPGLEQALSEFIKGKALANKDAMKLMIMPNDNDLVCTCSSCTKKGNTKNNASPAVFTLLNKLAKEFPQQEFFSTAYITTKQAPAFNLESNAGIMVSTMDFPKGIVIEQSAASENVRATFSAWKKVAGKIYLWDYAVNFDNYLDAYPTLSITQQNLKYYKELGVKGVFMQGSEDKYSAFADLKHYVYAQMLQNPDINIDEHIKVYFDSKYPAVASLMYDYYIDAEQRALRSVRTLDIYGGIVPSQKKYLDDAKLRLFRKALTDKAATLTKAEQQQLSPLLSSLVFQQLEVMRTNAFEDNGYAAYNYDTGEAVVKPEVKQLLQHLKDQSALADITSYNESGATIEQYVSQWEKQIIGAKYKNIFYARQMESTFEPDEDYQNLKMLNDGNTGFGDYHTNWFISTKNTISIVVDTNDVKNADVIEMTFLEDIRHKIHPPEKVVVLIGNIKQEAKVVTAGTIGNCIQYKAVIPIKLNLNDKSILIEAVKQQSFNNRSIACDEIYFK